MAALVEDYECCICMVAYTKERPPKLLSCGHSFCPPCLVGCCTDKAFTCPTCNQPHNLRPTTVNSLPTNYGLLGVAQRAEEAARRPQCQQHQRPWESRCLDCKKDLCLQCLIEAFSANAHTGHSVMSFNDLSNFVKKEVDICEVKVNKGYRHLLEKNARDVEVFQNDIGRLKAEINSNTDQAIDRLNQNRNSLLIQLETKSKKALESVQTDIRRINSDLKTFKQEIASNITQMTDENLVNLKEKATALEEVVQSFDSTAYFPNISIAGEVSVNLVELNIEEPQHPPTLPTLSSQSLGPLSPSTQHTLVLPPPSQPARPARSQEQPEANGQRPDLAASTQRTPASDVSLPYRQYASHGSYRVRGAAGVIHLCYTDNERRLVETMRPPPDAVVWCTWWDFVQVDPPRMPPTTETIHVDNGWDAAVRAVSQAERNQRRAVALVPAFSPDFDRAITPLLHHIASGRQHRADHVIVVYRNQDRMTAWQQQLEENTRVIQLQ